MPTLTFGLQVPKTSDTPSHVGQKRKQNLFDENDKEAGGDSVGIEEIGSVDRKLQASLKPSKAPRLGSKNDKPTYQNYTNLAAQLDAKKYAKEANSLDDSIYDYDNAYDSFHAPKKGFPGGGKSSGPKYITSLMQSAGVRKRDLLRAREKMLQREREAEGDEFADKEKFVTEAYKAQQEETKRMEAEEARKEVEEEKRRSAGGGMTGFYKDLLKKDEERTREIAKASVEVNIQAKHDNASVEARENTEAQIAPKLNGNGAHIIINDDGEVVDKRQLLSAGLNVVRKTQPVSIQSGKDSSSAARPAGIYRPSLVESTTQSQRRRHTQMLVAQLEEVTQKQSEIETEQRRAMEESVKSKKTGADITSAKERYLARKREKELELLGDKRGDG